MESVFRQTLEDFEVIVINDGSTDEALRILSEMVDPRLVVHSKANEGVSAARNKGVSLARAPWVAFLDADDEWLPTFLESTVAIAGTHEGIAASFSNLLNHQTGRQLLRQVASQEFVVRDYFAALLANDGIGMSSSSVLISKARILSIGGFDERVRQGEDIDLWARLAWSGDVAYCGNALAICHTEVPHSASKSVREAIAPYPAVLRSYEEWSRSKRIPDLLRDSSRRYANWILARHVMELAHHGFREVAKSRLRGASWRSNAEPSLWKAALWLKLPTPVLRAGRRIRSTLPFR